MAKQFLLWFTLFSLVINRASQVVLVVKNPPANVRNVRDTSREDPPEKEMAIYSSVLAWRIPWTEEPGRLPHMQL